MRAAILTAALSSVAFAWDTTSSAASQASVSNPAVPYLTQTNSLGVVTGQPTPIRSQTPAASIPAGLSSVPVVPSVRSSGIVTVSKPIGTGSSGSKGNSTSTALSNSAGVTRTATGSGSSSTGSSSSSSGSSSSSASANAAIMATAAPAGLGLGLAGAVFAAFL